ncbi:MAG: phosphotransferase [Dehalococcoidales bacterium]|nr:phosphotransferase [Dehalococcoidales bacterium]
MSVQSIQSIKDDIYRLGSLAANQLHKAVEAFTTQDLDKSEKVIEADDIFDTINLSIEDRAYTLGFQELEKEKVRFLRSAVRVSLNLERIGDAACHIARRVNIASYEKAEPTQFDLGNMESIAETAIHESVEAYLNQDLQLVEKSCRRETEQDEIFKKKIVEVRYQMVGDPAHITFWLYWYTILKYLEKVCDYTLNISEQALYLITGRRLNFTQYQQISHALPGETYRNSHFQPYYDGISGAITARIENGDNRIIYKEGSKRKIESEVSRLQQWQQIIPGITPRVLNTYVLNDRETLIKEYIGGSLLSELYFSDRDIQFKEEATRRLAKVMTDVWQLTVKPERPELKYFDEIQQRLEEVYAMHPHLRAIGDRDNLEKLLSKLKQTEHLLAPAFSVWLHGDYNVNNIVYDNGQIKFIDVHRSHYGDYLSDIGVFFISTIRPPDLSERVRLDMEKVRLIILEAITGFKESALDENRTQRLEVSLARSYITSPRIIMDKNYAARLFENGIELLKAVVN